MSSINNPNNIAPMTNNPQPWAAPQTTPQSPPQQQQPNNNQSSANTIIQPNSTAPGTEASKASPNMPQTHEDHSNSIVVPLINDAPSNNSSSKKDSNSLTSNTSAFIAILSVSGLFILISLILCIRYFRKRKLKKRRNKSIRDKPFFSLLNSFQPSHILASSSTTDTNDSTTGITHFSVANNDETVSSLPVSFPLNEVETANNIVFTDKNHGDGKKEEGIHDYDVNSALSSCLYHPSLKRNGMYSNRFPQHQMGTHRENNPLKEYFHKYPSLTLDRQSLMVPYFHHPFTRMVVDTNAPEYNTEFENTVNNDLEKSYEKENLIIEYSVNAHDDDVSLNYSFSDEEHLEVKQDKKQLYSIQDKQEEVVTAEQEDYLNNEADGTSQDPQQDQSAQQQMDETYTLNNTNTSLDLETFVRNKTLERAITVSSVKSFASLHRRQQQQIHQLQPISPVLGTKKYRAIQHHIPSREDELIISIGDLLVVLETFQDGWAFGHNLNTNQIGAFPLICL